jgi:hypothetical protein
MKLKSLFLIFLMNAQCLALTIGETEGLPTKIIQTSSNPELKLIRSVWVVGEDRTYEVFYDLKNNEITNDQAFEEIKEIFSEEKNSILELRANKAAITSFVADDPAYSCSFEKGAGWKPHCFKHE